MLESVTLAEIWFLLLTLLLFLYLWTDGFDLGVGMLLALNRDEEQREIMARSIEGVWHANQTWLVIAGGVLFGAFPVVYGSVLPALYVPVSGLLFSLMLRGVALEYRAWAGNKPLMDWLLSLGSLCASFCLGLLLAGVLQGIPLRNGESTGGIMDWFTPFSVFTALTVVSTFVLLGGCWLLLKTDGLLRKAALDWSRAGAWSATLLLLLMVVWIALVPDLQHLDTGLFTPLPLLFLVLATGGVVILFWMLKTDNGKATPAPLFAAGAALLCAMGAFAVALYPLALPPVLTLEQAASPPEMLSIMLKVMGALLPVIFLYNVFQYKVFHGAAQPEQ